MMETLEGFLGEKIIYDSESQMIFAINSKDEMQLIADVRGWGAIQNLFADKSGKIDFDAAYKFQDELGQWMANALNQKLKGEEVPVPHSETSDKWISVEDDAPEYYKQVLTYSKEFGSVVAWRASDGDYDFYTLLRSDRIIPEPTHWRPLPALPNDEPNDEPSVATVDDSSNVADPIKKESETSEGKEWVKERPDFKSNCIVATANVFNSGKIEVNIWQVKKVNNGDVWYSAWLTGDGDEYGALEDFESDLYMVLAMPNSKANDERGVTTKSNQGTNAGNQISNNQVNK